MDVHPHIQRLTSGGSTSKPSRTESESSDDPINCLTTQSPTFRNHRRIVPPNVVDSSRPQRRPGTTSASGSNGVSSHTAKDGDATMRLRKRLKQDDPINLDDLDIQSDGTETVDNFSDDTPMPALQYRADKPPPGNVRTKIAMLEQKTPTIDLSKKQTLSKKEAMKPRSYNSSTMVGVMLERRHPSLPMLDHRMVHSINQEMCCQRRLALARVPVRQDGRLNLWRREAARASRVYLLQTSFCL